MQSSKIPVSYIRLKNWLIYISVFQKCIALILFYFRKSIYIFKFCFNVFRNISLFSFRHNYGKLFLLKNNFIHPQINQLLINIEIFSKWYHVNSINFMVSLAITLLDSWPWASNHRWKRGIIALSPQPAKQRQT